MLIYHNCNTIDIPYFYFYIGTHIIIFHHGKMTLKNTAYQNIHTTGFFSGFFGPLDADEDLSLHLEDSTTTSFILENRLYDGSNSAVEKARLTEQKRSRLGEEIELDATWNNHHHHADKSLYSRLEFILLAALDDFTCKASL